MKSDYSLFRVLFLFLLGGLVSCSGASLVPQTDDSIKASLPTDDSGQNDDGNNDNGDNTPPDGDPNPGDPGFCPPALTIDNCPLPPGGRGDFIFTTMTQNSGGNLINSGVDILFVLDTSSSLNDEKQEIINGIDGFIDELPLDTDYRMGVIRALSGINAGRLHQTNDQEPLVLFEDETKGQNRQFVKDALEKKFNRNLRRSEDNQTSKGGEGESGIYSFAQTLNAQKFQESQDAGFFRPDTPVAVVFVSDENDVCSRGQFPNPFVNYNGFLKGDNGRRNDDGDSSELAGYKNFCVDEFDEPLFEPSAFYQQLASFWGSENLLLSGMVYTGETRPKINPSMLANKDPFFPVDAFGNLLTDPNSLLDAFYFADENGNARGDIEEEIGYGYIETVQQDPNGVLVDLGDPETIATQMEDIGKFTKAVIEGVKVSYLLEVEGIAPEALEVDPLSIAIIVNGAILSVDSFSFDPETNRVRILPDFVPQNATVEIEFEYREIQL